MVDLGALDAWRREGFDAGLAAHNGGGGGCSVVLQISVGDAVAVPVAAALGFAFERAVPGARGTRGVVMRGLLGGVAAARTGSS